MKKTILNILLMVFMAVFLGGCGEEKQVDLLEKEISKLQEQKSILENEVIEKKEESGVAKYVVTLEIKPSYFLLDMNTIEIQIPVDKEYYDSIEIGQNIADEFRIGSFVFKGTFGNSKVTVTGKEIQ